MKLWKILEEREKVSRYYKEQQYECKLVVSRKINIFFNFSIVGVSSCEVIHNITFVFIIGTQNRREVVKVTFDIKVYIPINNTGSLYNTTGSLTRFENKNILFYFEKRSSLYRR
jgi:hypothetical protein